MGGSQPDPGGRAAPRGDPLTTASDGAPADAPADAPGDGDAPDDAADAAAAAADSSAAADADAADEERRALLARRTEEGRLKRAQKLADKVVLQVAEADLVIAAVGSYNVVIDAGARRLLHGCRDFQGQAREGRLCKHCAAVFLRLEPELALPMLRELADDRGDWGLEVVTRFGSR